MRTLKYRMVVTSPRFLLSHKSRSAAQSTCPQEEGKRKEKDKRKTPGKRTLIRIPAPNKSDLHGRMMCCPPISHRYSTDFAASTTLTPHQSASIRCRVSQLSATRLHCFRTGVGASCAALVETVGSMVWQGFILRRM